MPPIKKTQQFGEVKKNTVTHDLQRWKTRLNCLVWSQGEDVCKAKFSLQVGLVVVCLIGLEQQADITPISYKEGKRKKTELRSCKK